MTDRDRDPLDVRDLTRRPAPGETPRMPVAVVIPTIAHDAAALRRSIGSAAPFAGEVVIVQQRPPATRRWSPAALPENAHVIDDTGLGSSRARNIGLDQVRSEWVLFLDDDAMLLPAFESVLAALPRDGGARFVSWRVRDATGRDISRFRDDPTTVTPLNHWKLVREHNTLWRRAALEAVGGFDESLGPGMWAGAEECAELVIRLLAHGWRGRYLPVCASTHPAGHAVSRAKARAYGRGAGRVMRRHALEPTSWPFIVRTLAGLGSVVLPSRYHHYPRGLKLSRATGIAEGLVRRPGAHGQPVAEWRIPGSNR